MDERGLYVVCLPPFIALWLVACLAWVAYASMKERK